MLERLFRILWLWLFLSLMIALYKLQGVLPDEVVQKWGWQGEPAQSSSKTSFIYTFGFAILFVNFVLMGLRLAVRWPKFKCWNIPNKAFWFSTPERESLLKEKIGYLISIYGLWLNVFLSFVLFFVASKNSPSLLPPLPMISIWIAVGIFVLGLLLPLYSFRRPKSDP